MDHLGRHHHLAPPIWSKIVLKAGTQQAKASCPLEVGLWNMESFLIYKPVEADSM